MARFFAFAGALGCVLALLSSANAAHAAAGKDMTMKGVLQCKDGDRRALAGATLEIRRSTNLGKALGIWETEAEIETEVHGIFEYETTFDKERNYQVRVHYENSDAELQDWLWLNPEHFDLETVRNDKNLHDFGFVRVDEEQCRVYGGFREAAEDYEDETLKSRPAGKVIAQWGAPTAGVPFAPYDAIWWPGKKYTDGMSDDAIDEITRHEFAHTARHVLDGSALHWDADVVKYWYAQHHTTGCVDDNGKATDTNPGFAFNEGWATYWSDQVVIERGEDGQPTTAIALCGDGTDYNYEANVARGLLALEDDCGLRRRDLDAVLREAGTQAIHSFYDFRDEFEDLHPACGADPGVEPPPVDKWPDWRNPFETEEQRIDHGGGWLDDIDRKIRDHREELAKAIDRANQELGILDKQGADLRAGTAAGKGRIKNLDRRIFRIVLPGLIKARIDQQRSLRKRFKPIAKRAFVGPRAQELDSRFARRLDRWRASERENGRRIGKRAFRRAIKVARKKHAGIKPRKLIRELKNLKRKSARTFDPLLEMVP